MSAGQRTIRAACLALALPTLAIAQAPSPAGATSIPQAGAAQPTGSGVRAGTELAEVERRLTAIEALDDTLSRRLASIETSGSETTKRLDAILEVLARPKDPSLLVTLMPAFIGLLGALAGVFVGGYVNDRLQQKRLTQEMDLARTKAKNERDLANAKSEQERQLAERQAKLQIGSAVVEWQLRQLSFLYGPMRALVGQSLALYRQMNEVLVRTDGERFRFANNATDVDHRELQIQAVPGNWVRFRTVIHISEVYGKNFGVETYFDEIVSIGARMVKIVERQAGYARPDQKDLMTVFAKYLAHFAVLKNLHEQVTHKLETAQH